MLLRQNIDVITEKSGQVFIIARGEDGHTRQIAYEEIEYVE